MTSFVSVATSAARYQDISLNPQKLAGQCAKLKCCLNYEVDCYVEAQKRLPSKEIQLETKDGLFYYFKADILANQITYSTDKSIPANLVTISGRRAFEVIGMNRKGIKPDSLAEDGASTEPSRPTDLVEQESLTRFDRNRRGKKGGEGNKAAAEEGRRKKKKAAKPQGEAQQPAKQNPAPAKQTPAAAKPAPAPAKPATGEEKKAQNGEPRRRNNKNKKPKAAPAAEKQPSGAPQASDTKKPNEAPANEG